MPPTDDTDDLRRKLAHAEAVIAELRGVVAELRKQVEAQQAHIHRLVKMTFGRGGERVEGPTLFDGYRNRIDATAASYTADGWFLTGDAAVIDDAGFHRIVGRQSTDIIKTGGFKVGAGEVEAALLAHPGVREAAVVGQPDPELGQRIVAYVVGDGLDGKALEAFVAEQQSVHKRPRQVRVVPELPRNAMGKVQKTLLPD